LTAAAGNARQIGRQGCTIRTDSGGAVYLFFKGAVNKQSVQEMTRSFDGGKSFDKPRAVASVTDVGVFDPVQQDIVFDGVTGARTDSFLSVDIANGAPYGTGATNVIALAWADARAGLNHEQALVQLSSDQGQTWTTPADGAQLGDRADFPASLSATALGAFTTLHGGAAGDSRASSANALEDGLLGDYNYAAATNGSVTAVWNDARAAADCPAVDAYRDSLLTANPMKAPAPANPVSGDVRQH